MEQLDNFTVAESASKEIHLLQAFVAVVGAGSFTKAAKRSRIDKSLLSRRVQALEDQLGVRLLQRTTRKIHVTDAGTALYDSVAEPLEAIVAALAQAAEPHDISGRLRVSTLVGAVPQIVLPAVGEMRRRYPKVTVEILIGDAMVDLVSEGIDVGVRVGRLSDSSLISRRLGTWRYMLCASPDWVAAHRGVTTPEAIADHWVLHTDVPQAVTWRMHNSTRTVDVRVNPVISINEGQTLLEAVRAGLGVSAFPNMNVQHELERGEVVRVLPEWNIESEYGVFAVYPHRSLVPRRVSVFLDILTARVQELEPRWNEATRVVGALSTKKRSRR